MYIKVIKCSDESYWYNDYIGKIFEPKFWDDISQSHVVDNIDGTGNVMGSIFEGDFEVVEDFDENDLLMGRVGGSN